MEFTNPYVIIALLIIVVVIIMAIAKVVRNNKAESKTVKLPFVLDELLVNIGNIDNVVSVNATMSKITIKLKDTSSVNIDNIKELGASGIVETKDGFSFIFGSISPEIGKQIEEKL